LTVPCNIVFESKPELLKHVALALLGAGQNELRHTSLLSRADFNKTTTDSKAIVTADTIGGVRPLHRGTVHRSLALRTNGTHGHSPQTAVAGPAGKTATAAAANAIGIVVGGWEVLAIGRYAAASVALRAATDASTDEVAHSLAALTGGKVLAALVLRGGLFPQILNGWWSTRLADRMLAGSCLTRTEGTGHWSGREADGTNKG